MSESSSYLQVPEAHVLCNAVVPIPLNVPPAAVTPELDTFIDVIVPSSLQHFSFGSIIHSRCIASSPVRAILSACNEQQFNHKVEIWSSPEGIWAHCRVWPINRPDGEELTREQTNFAFWVASNVELEVMKVGESRAFPCGEEGMGVGFPVKAEETTGLRWSFCCCRLRDKVEVFATLVISPVRGQDGELRRNL